MSKLRHGFSAVILFGSVAAGLFGQTGASQSSAAPQVSTGTSHPFPVSDIISWKTDTQTPTVTQAQVQAAQIAATLPATRLTTAGTSAVALLTLPPCRIMDTRNANGPLGGPYISAGMTRTIPIPTSSCNVPATASAYSLNFTVVPHGTLSYLTVWAAGQPQPVVSTLNSLSGQTIANAAIVPAGTAGAINAYANNDTDLIVDINGYFAPPTTSTLQFYPLTPCRILDTRNPTGTFGGPSITGGNSRSFPIQSSSCGVPSNAAAYSFNTTVVPQTVLSCIS